MIDYATLLNLLVHFTEEEQDQIELAPHVFHPSQLGNTCLRQVYLHKLELTDIPRGPALVGTLIHEFIENNLCWLTEEYPDTLKALSIDPEQVQQLEFEQRVSDDLGGIILNGRYDLFDPVDEVIIDWKTKADLDRVHLPIEEDLEQLTLYMYLQDAPAGQLVYIDRADFSTQPFPDRTAQHSVAYDEQIFKRLIARAWLVRQAIETHGIATAPEEIPFKRCGCWKCEREEQTLDLPDNPPAFKFPPRTGPPDCVDEDTLENVRSSSQIKTRGGYSR